jgi:sRNA-binding regulator protein Hfq
MGLASNAMAQGKSQAMPPVFLNNIVEEAFLDDIIMEKKARARIYFLDGKKIEILLFASDDISFLVGKDEKEMYLLYKHFIWKIEMLK